MRMLVCYSDVNDSRRKRDKLIGAGLKICDDLVKNQK